MVEELAIIFKRVNSDDLTKTEFVPYKVIEGYYDEEEDVFVDTKQNIYFHMASLMQVGNCYGGRINLLKACNNAKNMTISQIKAKLLEEAKKYKYHKNPFEYKISITNKATGHTKKFRDRDTDAYDELEEVTTSVPKTREEKIAEFQELKSRILKETEEETESREKLTPKQISEIVKKTIKGQDKAVESIVTLLWLKKNFDQIDKTNMLIIGPSGVGKTAIFKKLKQVMDIPLAIYPITGVSQSGYKGHDVEEMLVQLYYDSGQDISKAEQGIIVIDEFDKIAHSEHGGEVATLAVQNELLKIIEGCEKIIPLERNEQLAIDTSNITFVCCGAFSSLFETKKDKVVGFNQPKEVESNEVVVNTEKLIDYGIIRELAGRLPVIIKLNSLDKEILKDILINSDESNLKHILSAILSMGIVINNIDETIDLIVDDAIQKGIGARGLVSTITNIFLHIFYEIANYPNKYSGIIIGKNIINDNHDFELIPKQTKKRIKYNN